MRRESGNFSNGACVVVLSVLIFSFAYGQDKSSKIDALMTRYYEYKQFNGTVLVSDQGRVIYKKGFGLANVEWNVPNAPDTKFRLGSLTKQFTAALILQLVDEGRVRLDGKICDYLPDYPKKTGERVTIHQLLNHTSGIPSYTSFPDFFEKKSRDPYTPSEFLKTFAELDLEFEPGTKFDYNNSAYFLLGAIIEKVTGQPYEKALEERIFKPLNMTSSGYDHHGTILAKRAGAYSRSLDGVENAPYLDMSIPYAAGSLYSTVEDLYLWDQALYTEKPVPTKYKELMFKPGLQNYGYGFFIRNEQDGQGSKKITVIGHGGGINGFNTLIERVVEDKHLIVILNNTGGTKLGEMSQNIRKILYETPYKEPLKPISRTLYKTILDLGVESALKQYKEQKASQSAEYDFGVFELETLGRHLLRIKRIKDAVEIFKLNAEVNPGLSQVHNSLGDAYRESENNELAIKSYAKALELQPTNKSLVEKIRKVSEK